LARKILFLLFVFCLLFSVASAVKYDDIEVFDMATGKMIQKVENTRQRQYEIHMLINSIDGMYTKAKLDFKKGKVYKIPIQPTVHVENPWFSGLLSDVYLFQPEKEPPVLLLVGKKHKGFFMTIKRDIQPFVASLS